MYGGTCINIAIPTKALILHGAGISDWCYKGRPVNNSDFYKQAVLVKMNGIFSPRKNWRSGWSAQCYEYEMASIHFTQHGESCSSQWRDENFRVKIFNAWSYKYYPLPSMELKESHMWHTCQANLRSGHTPATLLLTADASADWNLASMYAEFGVRPPYLKGGSAFIPRETVI